MLKVNTMIENGTLKIFDSCINLRKEILDYKFPERTIEGKTKANGEKPMDKNNHAINAMEFLVMETPDNLKVLENKAYDEFGHEYSKNDMNFFKKKKEQFNNPYVEGYVPWNNKKEKQSTMEDIFIGTGNLEDILW
jgi:hypothetical protein